MSLCRYSKVEYQVLAPPDPVPAPVGPVWTYPVVVVQVDIWKPTYLKGCAFKNLKLKPSAFNTGSS